MKVCKHCGGVYPCWCKNPFYIDVWDWIVEAIRRCRG